MTSLEDALASMRLADEELEAQAEQIADRRSALREAIEALERLDGEPANAVSEALRRPRQPTTSRATSRTPAATGGRAITKNPVTRGQVLALFDTIDIVLSPSEIARMVNSTPAAVSQHLMILVREHKLHRCGVGRYQLVGGTAKIHDPLEALGPLTKVPFTEERARSGGDI